MIGALRPEALGATGTGSGGGGGWGGGVFLCQFGFEPCVCQSIGAASSYKG